MFDSQKWMVDLMSRFVQLGNRITRLEIKKMSGCHAYNTTAQIIPNTTWTPVAFESNLYDTEGYHVAGAGSTSFIAPVDGKYLFSTKIYYTTTSTPTSILLRYNIAYGTYYNEYIFDNKLTYSCIIPLPKNQAVTVDIYRNGGNMTIAGTNAFDCFNQVAMLT